MGGHVRRYFLEWLEERTSRKEGIEHHLRECNDCRRYYERMTALLDPGILDKLPALIPDPFMPTRISALAAGENEIRKKEIRAVLRLSLESFGLALAVLAGIALGRAVSVQPHQTKSVNIISACRNAISPEDFSTRVESVLGPLGENKQ